MYQECNSIRVDTLKSYTIQLGTKITNQLNLDKFNVAVDSTGFGIYGKLYRVWSAKIKVPTEKVAVIDFSTRSDLNYGKKGVKMVQKQVFIFD